MTPAHNLEDLPNDILSLIAEFLSLSDVGKLTLLLF